ncbi:MAG: hypothetical protein VZS44_00770 [Bacilli bacterium]|nr:hypothetical protein [Bacilli bacterium]
MMNFFGCSGKEPNKIIQMETTTTPISKEPKDKIKRICKFARVSYSIEEGSIVDFKGTNIAFAKPHILKVNNHEFRKYENNKELVYQLKEELSGIEESRFGGYKLNKQQKERLEGLMKEMNLLII